MERLLANDDVVKHLFASSMTGSESHKCLLSAIGSDKKYVFGKYALVSPYENTFIGYCGFACYVELDGQQEIKPGYRSYRQYKGQGFATEAAIKLPIYGQTKPDFNQMASLVRKDNEAGAYWKNNIIQ